MLVKREYTFNDLFENSWSGAVDTLKVIIDNDKESELMYLLEVIFEGEADETELNDFLWFESDYIFECLEINIED